MILPLGIALPFYVLILVISGIIYYAVAQAMRIPVRTGRGGLLNQFVTVKKKSGNDWIVQVNGETWIARCDEYLIPGQQAVINGIEGLHLHICDIAKRKQAT